MTLVLNGGLVEAIEQSEVDVLHSRLTAIKGINGNPMGVDIQKFGNATAFSVKNIPGPSFNTVKGFQQLLEQYTSIDKRMFLSLYLKAWKNYIE